MVEVSSDEESGDEQTTATCNEIRGVNYRQMVSHGLHEG